MNKKHTWKILRVLTTNTCNYRCIYCHNEGQKKQGNAVITFEQFKRIFNVSVKVGIDEVRFSGGEPLVNSETIDMIEWLNANSDIEIGLATNGSLVTEEVASRLGKTRTMVTLHFPAVDNKTYNMITGGVWKSFLRCVDLFDKHDVDYSFNYTLFPDTIYALEDVLKFTLHKGKRIKLLPYLDKNFKNLSQDYIVRIMEKLKNYRTKYVLSEYKSASFWSFDNGGCVKLINSPCYQKNISLCKEYGEIRLLPNLHLKNCIFGKSYSLEDKSDEEIISLMYELFFMMKKCDDVIDI